MNANLALDHFDTGRTSEQLRQSFERSYTNVRMVTAGAVIASARALSDGICSAYIVDAWTMTPYRRQGITRRMIGFLEGHLHGQHVSLTTDDTVDFYRKLGYLEQPTGMGKVVGRWLAQDSPTPEQ